jgi:hypothetical protein
VFVEFILISIEANQTIDGSDPNETILILDNLRRASQHIRKLIQDSLEVNLETVLR